MLKEIIGTIKKNNQFYCKECGADLSVKGAVTFVDLGTSYTMETRKYNCNKCHNTITKVYERDAEISLKLLLRRTSQDG